MENLTDQNFLRGLATLFVFIGFIGICIWAYLPSRKQELQDAANLPFSDEKPTGKQDLSNGAENSTIKNKTEAKK